MLRDLGQLRTLQLHNLGAAEALAHLNPLSNLASIGVGGMPDLRDLEALRFLTRPAVVNVYGCPALTDISAMGRWAETLNTVELEHCPAVDLTTLRVVRNLRNLDLWGSGQLNLNPIMDFPQLRWIMLGGGPLPDLRPLRNLPAFEALNVLQIQELDLDPLAGREGLTVTVQRPTIVHGADRLRPGSRVVRL